MILFSPKDKSLIAQKGITLEKVETQLEQFKKGFEYTELHSPAVLNDGILKLEKNEIDRLIREYQKSNTKVLKFVPASGVATRMFKVLFQFFESREKKKEAPSIKRFFGSLDQFAFYDDLKQSYEKLHGVSLQEALRQEDYDMVLKTLLNEPGLGYGSLPKGLLKFHKYKEITRTAVEEHIEEGLAYTNKEGKVNIHFTVSPVHQEKFEKHVREVIANHPTSLLIIVSFSVQKPSTDTIAVDLKNEPLRSDDGVILFRPAGHGALLENLNDLDIDFVFIKNIDNVVSDRWKGDTIKYKRVLAGVLLYYQSQVFELLERADNGDNIFEEGIELLSKMGWRGNFNYDEIISMLDRPIRVCGVVKNEGEVGGSPFWVKGKGGTLSLQVVESTQVDKQNATQMGIFESSTHFNPVDLICGLKNYNGEKFNLLKYQDSNAGFIAEKSYQGRKLKAMELPGLWNEGMAYWNTVCVDVPLITFNPVKTVLDLLNETHC